MASMFEPRVWRPLILAVAVNGVGACGAPLMHAPAPEHDASNPEAPAPAYQAGPNPLAVSAFEGEKLEETGHESHAGHAGHGKAEKEP